ncbi:hypothetical protein B0T16DRAFT_397004, partial [Cercophora newfieldiana]
MPRHEPPLNPPARKGGTSPTPHDDKPRSALPPVWEIGSAMSLWSDDTLHLRTVVGLKPGRVKMSTLRSLVYL